MKKLSFLLLFLVCCLQEQQAQTFKADDINIEYKRFVLPNGLKTSGLRRP